MANHLKRILAMLLAMTMCMGMLATTALADGEEHVHNAISCPTCGGSGKEMVDCNVCYGTGKTTAQVDCTKCRGKGQITTYVDCEVCGGDGNNGTCEACGGGGFTIQYQTCPICKGTCKVEQEIDCATCKGIGKVQTEGVCQDCSNGKILCTSNEFDQSELTDVTYESKLITGGTMTHSCSICGASYNEPLEAVAVQKMMAQGLSLEEYTVSPTVANVGQKLTYTMRLYNHNNYDLPGIQVQVQFSEGLTFTDYTSQTVVYFGGPYKGSSAPTYDAASAVYNAETGTLTITIPGIVAGKYLDATFYATVNDGAELGNDLTATISATASGQSAEAVSGDLSTHVNKYKGTNTIWLNGFQMGLNYDSAGRDNQWAAGAVNSQSTKTLDQLEQNVAAFTFPQLYAAGFTKNYGEDLDDGIVTNTHDGLVWTCVGFVPCPKNLAYSAALNSVLELKNYVYTEDSSLNFTDGTADEAAAAVKDAGGVLYGESDPDAIGAFFAKLEENIKSNNAGIICVWHVEPKAPLEKEEYGELTIDPVEKVSYLPISNGVTTTYGEVSYDPIEGFSVADVTITITNAAPNNVNINLSEILAQIGKELSEADGPNGIQPGDPMVYWITVDNQSGKNYQYVDGSMSIGTVPMVGEGSMGTGFEGYNIAQPVMEDGKEYSYVPWRVWNGALQELGVTYNALDDISVGNALIAKGYTVEDSELTGEDYAAQVTQECLSHYYLDYLNQYREEGNKATSFYELSIRELAMLTNTPSHTGTFIAEAESCSEVAEALYYFYYGHIFTLKGHTEEGGDTAEQSLYGWMNNVSELESQFANALETGVPFTLITQVDGQYMNNAFQNTKFGFGMQFQMSYTPSGSGTSYDYYDVTINYYDQEGTVIYSQYVSPSIREGRGWDYSDRQLETITVGDVTYTFDYASGDPISGTNIQRDQVVDLYYTTETDLDDDDTPLGPGPDGETDIPDGDVPQGDGTEIVDPDTPMGDLPQTGTAQAVNPAATAGLMALAMSMAAAGLFLTRKKQGKREED